MSWAASIASSAVINIMPQKPAEDVELINRFHRLVDQNPMESLSSFVNYLFETTSIWIIVTSEIFRSVGYGITEAVGAASEDKKEIIRTWSKVSLYYSWSSFVLPLIFLAGYFNKDFRDFYKGIEKPITEDTARRSLAALKEELGTKDSTITRLEAQAKETANEITALNTQLEESQTTFQLMAGAGGDEAVVAVQIFSLREEIIRLTRKESELNKRIQDLQEENAELVERLNALGIKNEQLESRLKSVEESKNHKLLELIYRLRALAPKESIILRNEQLERLGL